MGNSFPSGPSDVKRRAVKTGRRHSRGITTERRLELATRLILAATFAAAVATAPVLAAETPKRGGTLTYLIAADAPPSFDAHREQTYAVIQPIAPYYSVLIRINPENPSSSTD